MTVEANTAMQNKFPSPGGDGWGRDEVGFPFTGQMHQSSTYPDWFDATPDSTTDQDVGLPVVVSNQLPVSE